MTNAELLGKRTRLRRMGRADADGPYVRWMNDTEVTRYLESRFRSYAAEDLVDYIEQTNADVANHFFAIELRDDGRHVGNIKLGPVDVHHARGDIGIVIGDRTVWGQGIATEAICVLADWAFDALRLRKLTAGAYASNIASVRAFERAGFHVEAVRPSHYVCDDGVVDAVLLSRFAPDSS